MVQVKIGGVFSGKIATSRAATPKKAERYGLWPNPWSAPVIHVPLQQRTLSNPEV